MTFVKRNNVICVIKQLCGSGNIYSAYQIRMGGVKGVLAVDPTLPGEQVVVRNSMKKFKSDSSTLAVIQTSKPSKYFLFLQQ